jgi:hypothetical protein
MRRCYATSLRDADAFRAVAPSIIIFDATILPAIRRAGARACGYAEAARRSRFQRLRCLPRKMPDILTTHDVTKTYAFFFFFFLKHASKPC